jgi:hypothetical protein
MNECTNPQAPNTTIPHLLPFILLQERTLDDILGNFIFRVVKRFHKIVISAAQIIFCNSWHSMIYEIVLKVIIVWQCMNN